MNKILVFATFALASAVSSGAIRALTPAPQNADPDKWWMKRHAEKMSVVTNGGAKIVFIGDSITHFWETNGKNQLKKYFSEGDLKALDLGFSADRTEHVLWRLTTGKELDGYAAKAIFLMIGTNNSGHFPFEKEPPIDTILGIREILRVIRAKQPTAKIVLTAIFPRGTDGENAYRRRNDVVNKEIAKFADGKNIYWLDFNEQFMTADGRLPREVFPDLLHPGASGYELWAVAVLPYAQAALADLPMPPSRFAPFQRTDSVRMTEAAAVFPASRIREGGSDDWWLDRILSHRNQIADSNGEIDIVLFGDSIHHHIETRGRDTLAELRKTYTVLDAATSGDRTEHLLWRGENGELDGYRAKCVFLMIGTNNTWHRKDKPEDIAAGIGKILALIARKQPNATTLLSPIFPFGDSPSHPNRVNNEKANALIRGFADGKKVIWCDFNAKFLDEKGDNVKYMPDHCHPNAEGYREIWLPSVLPYFRAIVGK